MDKNQTLDEIDLKILSYLMADAKTSYTEIATKIYVSIGTVHVRVKKMEALGVVKGTIVKVDYEKLGFAVTCFMGIYLQQSSLYNSVVKKLTAIQEIVKIHYTTGSYNIFIKMHCRDTNHLREVLHDKIQKVEGIDRTETFIALDESMSRPIRLVR